MAGRFTDSFDHYGIITPSNGAVTTAYILAKWTGGVNSPPYGHGSGNIDIDVAYARSPGGQGINIVNNRGLYKTWSGSAVATAVMGFAVNFQGLPNNSGAVCAFLDSTSEQVSVRGDGSGHLTITRGGTVLATSTNIISTGVWYFLEFKATINNTTGVIELRINGTSTGWVASTSSLNTRSTANNQTTGVQLGGTGSNATFWADDFYSLDTTGSINNDFLGPIKVEVLPPAAAGNYAQWTSNGGANFGNVADMPVPDSDVTFNQSGTANQIDSFAYTDLAAASGNVYMIQHCIYTKQDAGAQRVIAAFQRSSSTDYPSSTHFNTSASYQYLLDLQDQNPDAGPGAWTVAGVNGAEFGVKLIS